MLQPTSAQRIPDEASQKQIAFFEFAGRLASCHQEQDNADQAPQPFAQRIRLKARGGRILSQIVERRNAMILITRSHCFNRFGERCHGQGRFSDDAIVTLSRTTLAQHHTVSNNLALIHDLFAATLANDSSARLTDDPFDRHIEVHRLKRERRFGRHTLVTQQLCFPFIERLGCVFAGELTRFHARNNPHRLTGASVNQRRCDFALVLNPHRATSYPTASCHGNPIGAATIGFHDGQQAFVALGQVKTEDLSG